MDEIRQIASSLENMKHKAYLNREAANGLIRGVLENHPEFLALWTRWEPNAFDNLDIKYQNTFYKLIIRSGNEIVSNPTEYTVDG